MKTYLKVGLCQKDLSGDFRVELTVSALSLDEMNKLRAIIPIAISELEDMWRRGQEKLDRHLTIREAPQAAPRQVG